MRYTNDPICVWPSDDDIKPGEEKELQITPEQFFCSLTEAKVFGQGKKKKN